MPAHQVDWPVLCKRPKRALSKIRVFYELMLGTVDVRQISAALLEKYPNQRPERVTRSRQCPIASIILDHRGRPIEDEKLGSVAAASLDWGTPVALNDGLTGSRRKRPTQRTGR